MPRPSIPPPNLKQKLLEKCKKTCLEASNDSIDLSCLYDCIVDGIIIPMKVKAALDKVFLAFTIATNISPIELRDIVVGQKSEHYFILYTCKSRKDICEYLAMNAAEHLERLPGIMAVTGIFMHPIYELMLIRPPRF